MPESEVKLIKTGRKIQNKDSQFWNACGALDSDEYYLKITFVEAPSVNWIKEFDNLKQLTSGDNIVGSFIKNIELTGSEYISDYFGINRFSKNSYEKLIVDLKKLIDDVNTKCERESNYGQ